MDSNEHFAVRFWTLTDTDFGLALAITLVGGRGCNDKYQKRTRESSFQF